jgi:hypothetical protein
MTDPTAVAQDLQGQILDTIRKSQEAVTDAVRTWADAVHSITPSVPVPPAPFADKLPKPTDLVANAYDFAEQLLATQRKFAEDILQATAPVLAAKENSGAAPKKGGGAAK